MSVSMRLGEAGAVLGTAIVIADLAATSLFQERFVYDHEAGIVRNALYVMFPVYGFAGIGFVSGRLYELGWAAVSSSARFFRKRRAEPYSLR